MSPLKDHIDLSVIIVNYKTPKLLFNCVGSVFGNSSGLAVEVIVVDNDSGDDSWDLITSAYPEVIWIGMNYNSGFSRANNAGIGSAKGDYILLLNSDTVIIGDCLRKVFDHYMGLEKRMEKPGLLGCKMRDINGEVLFSSSLAFPGLNKVIKANPIYIRIARNKIPAQEETEKINIQIHHKDHESAWISAAFAFCNADIFKKEGLYLDEDFFMYFEDYEWCHRLVKHGYKNHFYSGAEIVHVNCGSSASTEWKSAQLIISEWLYIRKTRGMLYFIFYIFALRINLVIDQLLYKRKAKKKVLSDEDQYAWTYRNRLNYLLKQYNSLILKKYSRKTSSSETLLKYHADKD
jgi:GT2 family glycosyltransferase